MNERINRIGVGLMSWIFICFLAPVVTPVATAQNPSTPVDGRVRRLPSKQDASQNKDVLAGHVRLLGKTLDQAIVDLQNAELREFARSYKRMIYAYGQLADHIGDASESVGDAQAQIMLAKESLDDIDGVSTSSQVDRTKLSQDIGQIRAMLIGRLGTIRAQYQAAGDKEQRELLVQMNGLVARIRQLDEMTGSLKDNSRPLLPGLAVSQMRLQLVSLEEALAEEEKVLDVVSQSARLMVTGTAREFERTMYLLSVEARIPTTQIAELQKTRLAVQSVMDEVNEAYRRATAILAQPSEQQPLGNAEDLLREADALLRTVTNTSSEP